MSWVFDHVEREVITKDELSRRMASRPGSRAKIDLSFIPDRPLRGRWIWDRDTQTVLSATEYHQRHPDTRQKTHMVIGALQDYKSMHDGSVIGGRTAHKEHLKRHGLVELGNDKQSASWKKSSLPPVEADIKETIEQLDAGIPASQIGTVGDQAKDLGKEI